MVKKENYQVFLRVGKLFTVMCPIRAVVETGAGPNLSHERRLGPEWARLVRSQSIPRITDASESKINQIGRILLSAQVGGLCAKISYWIVSNVLVDCILGTLFIDRDLRATIPRTAV